MKYSVGQKLLRIKTCQGFVIKKKLGFRKKPCALGFERVYVLRGPYPSLDSIVGSSELDRRFVVLS